MPETSYVPDDHKNFAYSTVATAPSPDTTGTSLVVASGDGTKFPAVPFNATVWPAGAQPTTSNSEIVRVTNISTDTFTIVRYASNPTLIYEPNNQSRAIIVGDQIAATITAKTLLDAEGYLYNYMPYYPNTGSAAVAVGSSTSASLMLYPFQVNTPVAAGWINLLYSFSWASVTVNSSCSQTWTNSMGLYTRQSGANSTRLSRLFQTSFTIAASASSNSGTISFPYTTGTSSYTWTTNTVTSYFSGMKLIQYGLGTTLAPNWYYLAVMNLSASGGQQTGGIRQSLVAISEQANLASIGLLGSHSSLFTGGQTGVGYLHGGGNWMQMMGSYTSGANQANFPAEITISQITQNLNNMAIMQFFSTS